MRQGKQRKFAAWAADRHGNPLIADPAINCMAQHTAGGFISHDRFFPL